MSAQTVWIGRRTAGRADGQAHRVFDALDGCQVDGLVVQDLDGGSSGI